jgi:hypothetical protein
VKDEANLRALVGIAQPRALPPDMHRYELLNDAHGGDEGGSGAGVNFVAVGTDDDVQGFARLGLFIDNVAGALVERLIVALRQQGGVTMFAFITTQPLSFLGQPPIKGDGFIHQGVAGLDGCLEAIRVTVHRSRTDQMMNLSVCRFAVSKAAPPALLNRLAHGLNAGDMERGAFGNGMNRFAGFSANAIFVFRLWDEAMAAVGTVNVLTGGRLGVLNPAFAPFTINMVHAYFSI